MTRSALICSLRTRAICLICLCTPVLAANLSVKGTVLDANRNPLSHAYVEARPVLSRFNTGTVVGNTLNPWIAADQSGHFELMLAPGRYKIRAKDEIDGFPDPTFWLNIDPTARYPEISVEDKDVTDVEVVLGKQGGILFGTVQDADVHSAIFNAKLRLQDARNSEAFVEIFTDHDGRFQYTVASKPILITVSAARYQPASVESRAEITLSPGEHRRIDINLSREKLP